MRQNHKWSKLHDAMQTTDRSGRRFGRRHSFVGNQFADDPGIADDDDGIEDDVDERIHDRCYDAFCHEIMGKEGDGKLLDACKVLTRTVVNTIEFSERGTYSPFDEIVSKMLEIAASAIDLSWKKDAEALANYQMMKMKYQELLERHRVAVKSHLAEILNLRQEAGRHKFDMTEYEADVKLYHELDVQDDEVRDLSLTVVNEKLRQLLRSPNRYLRDLVVKLFKDGETPSWVTTGDISAEDLQAEKERVKTLEHKLRLSENECERMREESDRLSESRDLMQAKLDATLAEFDVLREELELARQEKAESRPLTPDEEPIQVAASIPPEMLDELLQLREQKQVLELLLAEREGENLEKDKKMEELETRLFQVETELKCAEDRLNKPPDIAHVIEDRSAEVDELKAEVQSTADLLQAERQKHSATRKELTKLHNQCEKTLSEVRRLEELYASVCAELEAERRTLQQRTNQMRMLETALQQLQRKMKLANPEIDTGDIDLSNMEDRPWMSVFERLFKDAVEKPLRLEKLRESSRANMMKGLLEIFVDLCHEIPLPSSSVSPRAPVFPNSNVSSTMEKYLYGEKERKPRRETERPAKLLTSPKLIADVDLEINDELLMMPSIQLSTCSSATDLHRESSRAMSGVKMSKCKSDLVSKMKKKSRKGKRCDIVKCPNCCHIAPSIGIGWCLPPLD